MFAATAVAVAVAVASGQPSPAAPASGRSVPVRAGGSSVSGGGRALAVVGTGVRLIDLDHGTVRAVRLPAGVQAGAVIASSGAALFLLDRASGAAYRRAPAGTFRRLDVARGRVPGPVAYPVHDIVRDAAGTGAWLIRSGAARAVDAVGRPTGARIVLPRHCRIVGATPAGLVADTTDARSGGVIRMVAVTGSRRITGGEALAVAGRRVLLSRAGRLGILDLPGRAVHWLPHLLAVRPAGPAALAPGGQAFAALARTGARPRLIVGRVTATRGRDLSVLPLDGGTGTPLTGPVWSSADTVLAVRPDGRPVAYQLGAAAGLRLRAPAPVRLLSPG